MRKARMIVLALSVVLMFSVSAWGDVAVNATNFPDEVFRTYVSSNFDTDSDGVLSDSEIASVTSINVNSQGIATLEGVENFTALTELACYSNDLTALDVSSNTALTDLDCRYNKLSGLDVSNNTALLRLYCNNNQLTELDVSHNAALIILHCQNNQLIAIDLSSNTGLTVLGSLPQTRTVSLDTTASADYPYSVNLVGLNASFDISKVSVSSVTDFEGTDLTYNIDLSAGVLYFTYAPSTMVYTYDTGYSGSGGNMHVTLTFSGVSGDSGVEINAENFPDEVFRTCVSDNFDMNSSGILSESEIAAVTSIHVSNSGITTLKGVEYFTALTQLSCGSNQLTSLDVSNNTALLRLYCNNNQLTTLDVSKNTALTSLGCSGNQLTALDVSKNTALTELGCSSNQLTALDVSKNTALEYLYCDSNQLTALDVSNNTALTYLECGSNQLTTLDVSTNTALEILNCHTNQLTALDLSNNANLTDLNCHSQARTVSLDTTGNTSYPYSLNLAGMNASLDVSKVTIYNVYSSNDSGVSYNLDTSAGIVYFTSAPSILTYDYDTGYSSQAMDVTLNLSYSVLDSIAAIFGVSPSEMQDAESLSGAAYPDWSDALATAQTYANANGYFIITTGIPAITGLSSGTYYIADVSFLTPTESFAASADFEFYPNGFGNGTAIVGVFDPNGVKLTPETAKGTSGNYVVFEVNGDMTAPVLAVKQQSSPEVVEINATNFPDEVFRQYVSENFDTNSNGSLSEAEIAAATNINVYNMGIASLKGVEYFSALTWLNCNGNDIVELDVSQNTALQTLYCEGTYNYTTYTYEGKLASLNVNGCTSLGYLSCEGNQLTELDVSNNTALETLYCYSNQITDLDVSNNTALETLYCGNNQLTSLNVNGATALRYLDCAPNSLTELDVSTNTALETLNCDSNQLTALDVSNNTALTSLHCGNNQITDLDVSTNTALETLSCSSNQITDLDVSNNTALTRLECWSNGMTSLNVNGATALRYLDCAPNSLTALDVSTNTALETLYCYNNQLTELDVSTNTALTSLSCGYNSLGTIDVTHNTALTSLYVPSTGISTLDLSNNTALKALSVAYNSGITSLDLTGFQLGTLEVYGCSGLVSLDCSGNSLGMLTISGNDSLTSLNCEGQEIIFVDVLTETTSDDWPYMAELETLYYNGHLPFEWREQMYYAMTSSDSSTNISNLEILDESGNPVSVTSNENYYRTVYFSAKPATMTYTYSTGYSGSGNTMPVTVTFSDVSVEGVSLTSGHFPDSTFRSIITASFDVDGNGYLSDSELASVTSLNLSGKGISNLTGIRYFTSLTHLDCANNSLTSLSLTSNGALTYLDVSNNELTTLDVSRCTALQTLICQNNKLTVLDVSNNTALTVLYCGRNDLTELDITHNTALTELLCNYSDLVSLDISKNTNLVWVDVGSNDLTALDVSNNTALESLVFGDNRLTALDVSNNTALKNLDCSTNQIAALDLSRNNNLLNLMLFSQTLTVTSLDYTGRSDYLCSLNLTEIRDALGISVDIAYYVANVYSLDIRDSEGETVTHSTDVDAGVVYFAEKPATITYCYDTGYTGSSSEIMDVTVTVERPALSVTLSPARQTVTTGSAITPIVITVSNAWGSYDLSVSGLPGGLTLSEDRITGTPSGSGTFTVTATDSDGSAATATGTITVNAVPVPEPIPSGITAIAITDPAAKTITLSADGGDFSATLSASGTAYGSIVWSVEATSGLIAEISGSETTATLSGSAQPNNTSDDRSGTITITAHDDIGTDYTDTLTVIVGGIFISGDVISGDVTSGDVISGDVISGDVTSGDVVSPDVPGEENPGQDDEGDGSSWSSARRIDSPSAFMNMLASFSTNMYFTLTEDIDLSSVFNRQPIGTESQPFTGHFNGGGRTITYTAGTGSIFGIVSSDGIAIQNLNVVARRNINNRAGSNTPPETFAGGIVQELVSGTIDSCTFTGSVNASGTNSSAGGIVGELSGGNITNCRVLDGSSVYATHSAGGIAGYVYAGSISGCSSSAQVEAEYFGGIAGYTETERRNITSNTYTAAALEVGNDTLTLELAPISQDVTAGDSITDIVISGDNVNVWSFSVSPDYALGLTSNDTAITGTIPAETPAGRYTLTVNAVNTNGFTASAQAFITVKAPDIPDIPDNPDRPSGTNRVIHAFDIPQGVRSRLASRFNGAEIFQFTDDEIDYQAWELEADDMQAITEGGESVTILLPQMRPRNSGVYLLRLTLGDISTGTNLKLQGITGGGEVSASALEDVEYVFLDEEGNEITRVPENGIVYAAMRLTSGRTHRGVITSPRELERGTIEPVELSESLLEKIAETVSISADAIKFITEDNISEPQEPTQGMRDEIAAQNAEIIGKLNTLTVEETGYYVFKVTLSDDLYEQIRGVSISELKAYALHDDGTGEDRPEGANVKASFITGLLNTWELLSLSGEKLEFGVKEFLMVGLLNAGTPFSVYITKLLIMLLLGGCDSGLGLAGLAALGLSAIYFTLRNRR